MTTATESATNLFEATFNNLRQALESAVQLQQEMYKEWARLWPGLVQSTVDWNANIRKWQKEWATRTTGAMRKHLELVDHQYRVGIESLEAAFQVAAAKDPEEFRERCEALCRQALNLVKETSETQTRQFQEAMNKWVESCQMKH